MQTLARRLPALFAALLLAMAAGPVMAQTCDRSPILVRGATVWSQGRATVRDALRTQRSNARITSIASR